MPSIDTLLLFTAAALLMNISPGPSNFYVMSRSIAQGSRAGLVSAFGLAAGSLVHVLAAAFGLSAIFVYSPLAYTILKTVGAAYLIYLGARMLLSGGKVSPPKGSSDILPLRAIFSQSVWVEVLNPKTALFFLAFLPQFVDVAAGNVSGQILLLGTIVTLTALPCDFAVALASGSAAHLLRNNPIAMRIQSWLSGTILIGLGVYILLSRRDAA
jgi:threonine/homoserine/homoserine lactone efflux protein